MSFGAGTAETQLSNQEQGAAGQQYNALGTEGSTITGLFNNLLQAQLEALDAYQTESLYHDSKATVYLVGTYHVEKSGTDHLEAVQKLCRFAGAVG